MLQNSKICSPKTEQCSSEDETLFDVLLVWRILNNCISVLLIFLSCLQKIIRGHYNNVMKAGNVSSGILGLDENKG
jgi:hypothetical protein